MILGIFNLLIAVLGALALAVGVFVYLDQPLQRKFSGQLTRRRMRFFISPLPAPLHELVDIARSLPTTSRDGAGAARDNPGVSTSQLTDDMANLLDAIGREMRLGGSLVAGFIKVHADYPTLAKYFEPIAHSCERGATLAAAIRASEITISGGAMPECIVFGSRSLWAASAGTGNAMALERAASTLRERNAIGFERHAQSAQARLSIQIMTWLPIALLTWLMLTDIGARWFLLMTSQGWLILALGLGANWFGRKWMRRLLAEPKP